MIYGKTIFERSMESPPHVVEARRERRDACRAEVDRLTLALKYCEDEGILAQLLEAEDRLRRCR